MINNLPCKPKNNCHIQVKFARTIAFVAYGLRKWNFIVFSSNVTAEILSCLLQLKAYIFSFALLLEWVGFNCFETKSHQPRPIKKRQTNPCMWSWALGWMCSLKRASTINRVGKVEHARNPVNSQLNSICCKVKPIIKTATISFYMQVKHHIIRNM